MSKRHAAAPAEPRPSDAASKPRLSPWSKAVISGLLAVHISAVFVAPLAFACDWSSPLVNAVVGIYRPYIDALYLNHGYFFFAPNPGPSHLVDYTVEFGDGRPPRTGRIPDLASERPRLLYHRHFMLSEALHN